MKINKTWHIYTDLEIGSTAGLFKCVQLDQYSYVIKFRFVRNRRAISQSEDLSGKIFLHFYLPNGEQIVELVDIEYDSGVFPIPNSFLAVAGTASLQVEERDALNNVINNPNSLEFEIKISPWEVS